MTIEKVTVDGQRGLDPVYAYFENYSLGQGRVILVCYDMAWTAYWGAMGDKTVQQFFSGCGVDYLCGNFGYGRHYKSGAQDRAYLKRVIQAVHDHLNSQQAAA